jgi:JmjC domain
MPAPRFEDLIAPLSMERWREQFVAQRAVVIRAPLERLGGLRAIDLPKLLAETKHVDILRGGVGHASDGAPVATPHSTRIRRVQVLDEALASLAHDWMTTLREELNLNLYLSPAATSPGLAPHVDPYDALVVQLTGRKAWTLLGDPDGHLPDEPLREEAELLWGTRGEFELTAGDVLYLPRGLRHRAQNPGPDASLHLTVGIYVKTKRSLIAWLAHELDRRLDGRRALPLLASDDDYDQALAELEREVRAVLDDPRRREAFIEHRDGVEYDGLVATPDERAKTRTR